MSNARHTLALLSHIFEVRVGFDRREVWMDGTASACFVYFKARGDRCRVNVLVVRVFAGRGLDLGWGEGRGGGGP